MTFIKSTISYMIDRVAWEHGVSHFDSNLYQAQFSLISI